MVLHSTKVIPVVFYYHGLQFRPWTVRFDASPSTVHELKTSLSVNTQVIRSTIVKQPPVYKKSDPKFHKCKNLATGNPLDDTVTKFVSNIGGQSLR